MTSAGPCRPFTAGRPNTQAALNGDVVALIGVLDYSAQQVVGISFFDRRQGLKLANRFGLGWYDDVMGYLGQSLKSLDNLDALHSLLQKAFYRTAADAGEAMLYTAG